jgi:hypothetical protein
MEEITSRLRSQTADVISAGKSNPQELRRLVRTIFQNLNTWFDSFHDIVVRLGFARKRTYTDPQDGSEVIFFPGQEERIINFAESPVSIGNTSDRSDGQSPTTFFSTSLPISAAATNKTGYICTVICGSTAAGTPLPPDIQLKPAVQTADREHINITAFSHVEGLRGKFGHLEEKLHGISFGMNENGGMDDSIELANYIERAILPLFPDVEDNPGKRILVKVDNGPGTLCRGFQRRRKLRKRPNRITVHSIHATFTTWKPCLSFAMIAT